jgi:phosphoribosylaminoimidazole-succinocarboxamide synthase
VAEPAGIILADTKFEFGIDRSSGELLLIDEVLTPDSSRFWDAAAYEPGRAQASFDKQFVRDWLETQPWDKTPPGPALPAEIVAGTRARYVEAFERITGASFERYLAEDVIAR